ncbi:MAG: BrnA antitoxin family protein [Proteobacteria bacterium]|nr:BrnA antitoxin family protein [Pseudomonadota bacterium]
MTRQQVATAVKVIPVSEHFVWDGVTEEDRPLSKEEMLAGMAAAAKKRGRPMGSGAKEQVAIRFDRDVLAAFRAAGPGWQTRMNDALKDWLSTHKPA